VSPTEDMVKLDINFLSVQTYKSVAKKYFNLFIKMSS
jgi:hypothetical protein